MHAVFRGKATDGLLLLHSVPASESSLIRKLLGLKFSQKGLRLSLSIQSCAALSSFASDQSEQCFLDQSNYEDLESSFA